MRPLVLCLLSCCTLLAAVDHPLADFTPGMDYAYLSWQQACSPVADGVRIQAADGKGGAGINPHLDLTAHLEHSPLLRLTIHPENRAQRLRLALKDADGSGQEYWLDLPAEPGEYRLHPASGASLALPDKIGDDGAEPGFDAARLGTLQVIGDWKDAPVAITVHEVRMLEPTDAIRSARAELAAKLAAEAERRERQAAERRARIEELLAGGAAHGDEGLPEVERIYPVGPRLLAVRIQERRVDPAGRQAHVAQDGDQRVGKKKEQDVLVWRDGELVREPKGFELERGGKRVGTLTPDEAWLRIDEDGSGAWLHPETVGEARAYALVSDEDPAWAEPTAPDRVDVKRKPNAYRSRATATVVYLHLPQALTPGASYTLRFPGINTRQAEVPYVHDTRTTRSEAVHVSHVGFHPRDPAKLARVSCWLGSGGAYDIGQHGPLGCELIDEADGSVVWSGEAGLVQDRDAETSARDGRNLARTEVYLVDFSAVETPGRYRLHVAGVGCSHPFPIAEDAWTEAFRISMQGLLSHRSGIALPQTLMGYERPRNMHPADGFRALPIPRTMLHGEVAAIQDGFDQLLAADAPLPEPMAEAWGGYMDAGDWDRRSQHLEVTGGLLELYDLAPRFWNDTALVVPEAERANQLPDLLDEVRWNLDFYHRLQTPEGGVRGGIESTSHPRPGEASWEESLAVGVFAPDPVSSLRFATVAAQYARVAAAVDPGHAARLRDAALRAWEWAVGADGQAVLDTLPQDRADKIRKNWPFDLAEAAVQLLWLTGEARFRQPVHAVLGEDRDPVKVEGVAFTYARMPAELVDPAQQATARAKVLELGEVALAFQDGNAWGLATAVPSLPLMGYVGYLSVPGMISKPLARAHALSGEDRFLAGLVESCAFAAGANPDNRAYTTGLGPDPVRWPLHIDSLVTGQAPPAGITVYGPGDPAAKWGFEKWVYQWYVNATQATPKGDDWPMAEAYWDIWTVPANNEYTVHQTIGPTAYHWGYLAACER